MKSLTLENAANLAVWSDVTEPTVITFWFKYRWLLIGAQKHVTSPFSNRSSPASNNTSVMWEFACCQTELSTHYTCFHLISQLGIHCWGSTFRKAIPCSSTRFINKCFSQFDVEELDCIHSHPTPSGWHGTRTLGARPHHPTSVSELDDAEWEQIPAARLQNDV